MKTDFLLQNEGTISILHMCSKAAKAWVADHLPEEAMRWGHNGVVIEHHYVGDIVNGIINDGLEIAP